jgi:hypothetical protein
MGFPLSTDIFGQLAWLVRQVKILIFRVTRIEQNGGGGAQTIDQVLATGNTAADKFLKINDTTTLIEATYSANSILMTNTAFSSLNCGLVADFSSDPVFKTTINDADAGFYFYNNKTFTIGKENAGSYFGIKTDESVLLAGGIRRTDVDYNTPSGFIPIRIDGTDYYIELWTT